MQRFQFDSTFRFRHLKHSFKHYFVLSYRTSLSWPWNCWSKRLSLCHVTDTMYYCQVSIPSLSLPWHCWSKRLSLCHVTDTMHYCQVSIPSLSLPWHCWSKRLSLCHVTDTMHYFQVSIPSLSWPSNCWSSRLSLFHCNWHSSLLANVNGVFVLTLTLLVQASVFISL